MPKSKLVRYQDIKDNLFGAHGTPERDAFEQECKEMLVPMQLLKDQRQIESSLANDEYSSDQELLADLISFCPGFDPALIERIIQEQRPWFFLEPLHIMNWQQYGLPNGIWND